MLKLSDAGSEATEQQIEYWQPVAGDNWRDNLIIKVWRENLRGRLGEVRPKTLLELEGVTMKKLKRLDLRRPDTSPLNRFKTANLLEMNFSVGF